MPSGTDSYRHRLFSFTGFLYFVGSLISHRMPKKGMAVSLILVLDLYDVTDDILNGLWHICVFEILFTDMNNQ